MILPRAFQFTVCFLLICAANHAQKIPPKFSFGVEFRSLQNFGILNADSVVLTELNNEFRGVYRFSNGIGFGGILRIKLTDFWNVETGINYARQRYQLEFADLITGQTDESELDVVTYELPAKGLVYIQLGEQLFANVALGVSLNFVASNVEVFGLDGTYSFGALQERVFNGAVLGGVGVEFRSEEDGYFYVGGSFHQPFSALMTAQVTYQRDRIPPGFTARDVIAGSYFGVDLRYFFPTQESKEKTKYYK